MKSSNLTDSQPGSLTAQVEALAVDLKVRTGTEPERMHWSTSMLAVSAVARETGKDSVASIARDLAKLACDPDQEHATLEAGLIQLQKALAGAETVPAKPSATAAPASLSLAQDAELIADFVGEAREHLDNIEARLLSLEQDSEDMEAIHSVFRSFHTIKGVAGFLELKAIQEVSHEIETLLDLAREAKLSLTPPVIDVILEARDFIGRWLNHLDRVPYTVPPAALNLNADLLKKTRDVMDVGAVPISLADVPAIVHADAATAIEAQPKQATPKHQNRSVKISTDKLDYLVDMVGEMVIAQSLVRCDPDLVLESKPRLARNLSQMAHITDEVQRTAMAMRMIPIGPLFQKMARLVRDLARKFGKNAELITIGEDVQLDRNIVEELADPLMHMVRNAVDHGIDTPAERAAAGKSISARIELRALHQSGQIVIQISDDGRGLNREKILAKARQGGLIAGTANISESECFNLIFSPGFSTAEQVSDVSGRGVGMDVVKKQIQKLRGSIDIQSTAGKGSVFSLTLPLTLAIIEGLVVGVGEERYVIPIYAVREMFRPAAGMVSTIENRAEVVLLRNTLVPVIRLYERFGIESRTCDPEQSVMVVSECDGKPFCLMVDELIGKQEVVIKSLGAMFAKIAGVAGGAILNDGHVGLILDMHGVFGKREVAA
jgi:two-component system chemotaxis sensor kinase CheA